MATTATDANIPLYTLAESIGNNATDFFIHATDGKTKAEKPLFLVPHRRDYYLFALVKEGSSKHWVDMRPYQLQKNCFYFTIPSQVHLKEDMKPIEGILLCFTHSFLSLAGNGLADLPIIRNREQAHELKLTKDDLVFLEETMRKMIQEAEGKARWRNTMLDALLQVLLVYLSRLYVQQCEVPAATTEHSILKKFLKLIGEQHTELHDVAGYAQLLNISPGYLGELAKQQSGKPAIDLIHERLLIEAKRLLFHSEASAKEISFQLGFSDVSYFGRFFKRMTNETPLAFRNNVRKMYHTNG